jgi:YVTN family beta-propeller protein
MAGASRALLRSALVAAIAAVATCFVAASASAAPLLWAVNTSTGSVSVLEGPGGREVGLPIKTGESPNSIAITPNGQRAYVTNFLGNSVTVIETGTRIPIKTIPLTAHAESIAISPDGKTAYVTVEAANACSRSAPNRTPSPARSSPGPKPRRWQSARAAKPLTSASAPKTCRRSSCRMTRR